MATTIKQAEAIPENYPDLGSPSPLSAAALALDIGMVWQRIELYVAWRWTPRAVVWTVEGPGEWNPPLAPATIGTVARWTGGAWEETFDLCASPYGGYFLPGVGPYRFSAIVGGGSPSPEVPAVVLRAVTLVAEFMAQKGKAGVRTDRVEVGSVGISTTRDEAWRARAIDLSGAGDLLRPYRRVA